MLEDGTTNRIFTKQEQLEWRKKVLEERKNRFLQIELGMPPETFFKTHDCFGVKIGQC